MSETGKPTRGFDEEDGRRYQERVYGSPAWSALRHSPDGSCRCRKTISNESHRLHSIVLTIAGNPGRPVNSLQWVSVETNDGC